LRHPVSFRQSFTACGYAPHSVESRWRRGGTALPTLTTSNQFIIDVERVHH
jgi:hypothetical protein